MMLCETSHVVSCDFTWRHCRQLHVSCDVGGDVILHHATNSRHIKWLQVTLRLTSRVVRRRHYSRYDVYAGHAYELWSLKSELWSVKYEVWTVKCEVVRWRHYSRYDVSTGHAYELWSLKSELWSVKYEVWSLKCLLPLSSKGRTLFY